MARMFCAVFLFLTEASAISAAPVLDAADQAALKAIMTENPNIPAALGWTYSVADGCSYNGVTCTLGDDGLNHVTGFSVSEAQNLGPMPASFNALLSLTEISLGPLTFVGPLPSLDQLANLQTLGLRGNNMRGSTLDGVFNVSAPLTSVDLGACELTGSVDVFAPFSALVSLSLAANEFTGYIYALVPLVNLTTLDLEANNLTGPIEVLSRLTNLQSLSLSQNEFTGEIPALENSAPSLNHCDMQYNNFTCTKSKTCGYGYPPCDLQYQLSPDDQAALTAIMAENQNLASGLGWTFPVKYGCSYAGVTCTLGEDGLNHITGFSVNRGNIGGPMPPSINALLSLTAISLEWNVFTGPLPSLNQLANLQSLVLAENNMQGSTLDGVFNVSAPLTYVDLEQCGLTGFIDVFGDFGTLKSLVLDANDFTGSIDALAGLTNLTSLNLGNNMLEGSITNLTNLTNLEQLVLLQNQFTGEIPALEGSAPSLNQCEMQYNNFTCTRSKTCGYGYPPCDLQYQLSPDDQAALTAIMAENPNIASGLGWTFPVKYGCSYAGVTCTLGDDGLNHVTGFSVNRGNIGGPMPPSINALLSLTAISLEWNVFTGPLPSLDQLANLQTLALGMNNMQGSMLDGIFNVSAPLTYVNLEQCGLTGSIDVFGAFGTLQSLMLDANGFTGYIYALASLTNLTSLSLNSNQLDGTINILDSLPNLQQLDLSSNKFTGVIPDLESTAKSLNNCDMMYNDFTCSKSSVCRSGYPPC
eukprot:TRINITY_DN1605_c0_g1_i1.p1 TRINITY_DN1605_c0_g1~~TRINITY_DN1605_c0_g1_i1.p1  ORF type:complete len:794 (+),score=-44.47 TRINITY_DN1605_c0_g1_i1:123-2384(+)